MRTPEIKKCPSCDRELEQIPDGRENFVAECVCGFFASTRDMVHADYVANLRPLPSIAEAARRIAAKEPLNYSSAREKGRGDECFSRH